MALLVQPIAASAQERLDTPTGLRVVEVEPIPALTEYARARLAQTEGDDEAALVNYRKILPYATDPSVASQIFRAAVIAGDRATALAAIAPFSDMSALPLEAPLLKISEAMGTGDWKEARLLTEGLSSDTPFDFLVPSLRALIAMGAREADPFQYLNGLRRGSLDYNYAERTRALIIAARGSKAEAINVANGLMTSRFDSIVTRLALADRLAQLGARDNALKMLEGRDPLLMAARSHISEGRKIGTAANSPAEGFAVLLSGLSEELAPEGVTSLALTLQRLADFLAPNNAVSPMLLSSYLVAEGHDGSALKVLAEVKPKSPYYVAARERRVKILIDMGRGSDAVTTAREWTRSEAKAPAAWEALGDALIVTGDHDGAITAYQKQLSLLSEGASDRWRPLFLIGKAQEKAGRWPDARKSLEAALAIAPKEPQVLNALGYGMAVNGEGGEKAIGYLRTARMIEPANPVYADSLGWAYVLSGDPGRGAAILESAVKIAPGNSVYNEHLGDAYWLSGRKVEARYSWAAASVYAEPERKAILDARIRGGLPAQ